MIALGLVLTGVLNFVVGVFAIANDGYLSERAAEVFSYILLSAYPLVLAGIWVWVLT